MRCQTYLFFRYILIDQYENFQKYVGKKVTLHYISTSSFIRYLLWNYTNTAQNICKGGGGGGGGDKTGRFSRMGPVY